jgi:predicted RNA polymerase sigma factor
VTGVDLQEAISHAHGEEWARVIAALARRLGDLDVAEDAAAEAFAAEAFAAGRRRTPTRHPAHFGVRVLKLTV